MADDTRVRPLREQVDAALRRGELAETLDLLAELERLEPEEPRWPHRRGDGLLRLGRRDDAVRAYEEAVDRYAALGFLTRAVAMAKVVLGLDPERVAVLERVDPEAARAVHRRKRPAAFDPREAPPEGVARAAPKLAPAADATADEVRFADADDERSIEIDLTDVEILDDPGREPPAPGRWSSGDSPTASTLALLPVFPLFAEVERGVLLELASGATLVELEHGAVVLHTGEPADALYAIVEGAVRVRVPDLPDGTRTLLSEGDVFGESCLLDGARRRADVHVEGKLVALRIPKATLDEVADRHPRLGDLLLELLTRRLVANLIRTSSLFSGLPTEVRRDLARMFEVRRADPGTLLLEAGKRSDGLYVVLQGGLTVDAAGREAPIGPGAVVGQRSLLSHGPSEITVEADTELLVLRLPAARFLTLVSGYPPVLEQLSRLAEAPVDEAPLH